MPRIIGTNFADEYFPGEQSLRFYGQDKIFEILENKYPFKCVISRPYFLSKSPQTYGKV